MSKYALLEYSFIFESNSAWSTLGEFENDLADFFSAHGVEAEVIKTIDGQVGRRIMLLKKIEELLKTPKPKDENQPKDAIQGRNMVDKKPVSTAKIDTKIFETKDKRKPIVFD